MTRLMTYNIQEGGGPASRRTRLLEVIGRVDPDVLFVCEGVGWTPGHEVAEALARALGAEYRIAQSQSGFNLAFYSRLPIRAFEQPVLPGLFHALAWITVETPGGTPLTVAGAHLDYREEEHRVRELEEAVPCLAPLLDGDAALVGDLNAIAPADSIMGLSQDEVAAMDRAEMPEWLYNRYPPRAFEHLTAAGWLDPYRDLRIGTLEYTMSTEDPNARYDYILTSPSLAAKVSRMWVETAPPASGASDHFPVVAELDA